MRLPLLAAALAVTLFAAPLAHAAGLGRVRFVVVDPATGRPADGFVAVDTPEGRRAILATGVLRGRTVAFDVSGFRAITDPADAEPGATTVTIPLGTTVTLRQSGGLPAKEIEVQVTATRLVPSAAPASGAAKTRDQGQIQKFTPAGPQDAKGLTKGQAGVAEDSAGQAHIRGEHGDISYVVDGVPLPDTLSGRQGSVVVSSTIQSLEIITGGFAPEFGGQTAAVLNVTTLGNVARPRTDYSLLGGSYDTFSGDLTSVGPLGRKASYVFDLNGSRTRNFQEPQQPDRQDAHNEGSELGAFARFRFAPGPNDVFALTVSGNPAEIQIPNRTGLPGSFSASGQGYGLFGRRNADGTRPDATPGTLGSDPIVLRSQEAAGQDIVERDVNEFSTLAYARRLGTGAEGQLALTLLHSGQDVTNNNPSVDLANLPVDNSIEFNPSAYRNVHHVQLNGSVGGQFGDHRLKAGFLYDAQSGVETYRLVPGSQLALDALAAGAPALAPAGTASAALDVNGNPIFTATGPVPTVVIERKGYYAATYAQDTWRFGRFIANYGLRGDWYGQSLNGGATKIDRFELSPRVNLAYDLNARTTLHASYNHILNTPPIAQGASLGQVIPPETLDQYDLSLTRNLGGGQRFTAAYYAKQVKDQFDTALLIPGSQIGVYRTVNNQRAGVHGIELGYEIAAPRGANGESVGWDGYANYSYSAARPNGLDNRGNPAPDYNDHDQRHTVGAGLAYTLKSGASLALTYQYGSGLASSVVPPSASRTSRDQFDLKLFTGNRLFRGRAGLTLEVQNLFDSRKVINYQSDFSGTRFQQSRRLSLGLSGHL